MAEIFVTLDEVADLEEMKYKSVAQAINRNKEKYLIKTEKSDIGGKDRVLIAISSLSQKAQNKYRKREELNELTQCPELGESNVEEDKIPWYVDAELEWYMETYKDNYYKAVELGNIIREFLTYEDTGKTSYAEEFAQEHLGKSARSMYRYVESYMEGTAWAFKKNMEDGYNYDYFKVLSLCRKPKDCGQFPSFKPEVKQAIKNIWFNSEFAANNNTVTNLYKKLEEIAVINRWEKIPSYQSVDRYINHMMDNGMKNAHKLSGKGVRVWKNECMMKTLRKTKDLKVMEMVQGDAHTFDCWIEYKNPNGTKQAIKPTLVAWIDMRSRVIMGDVICKDSNASVIRESVLKMIYPPNGLGGVAEYILIDNGKDFTGKSNTGRNRKQRSSGIGYDTENEFDDVVQGFYKAMGIKDDHRALPYQPWTKGDIERAFRTVCSKFSRKFKSYTGTLTGSRTDGKVPKEINKMLERGELLTREEFFAEWTKWLNEEYMHDHHDGLMDAGEQYKTPYEVFMNEEKYEKAAPPRSQATMLMLESDKVRVNNTGITRFGYHYTAPELCHYISKTVKIKYDPNEMDTIYVFDEKSKQICVAVSYELMGVGRHVNKDLLKKHLRNQKRQLKEDKEKLEDALVPFETMCEQYVGFSSVTGGVDLMIGKETIKAKVVAMPTDRTYRQNGNYIKRNKEEEEQSKYISKTAEEALEKIRAL